MTQQLFTHAAILVVHKTRTDALRLNVVNEFVNRKDNHYRNFGLLLPFPKADLDHLSV